MTARRHQLRALELSGGKLSHAAKRLGVTHQRLTHILKTRHRNLRHKRTLASRPRSYTGAREPRRTGSIAAIQKARPVSILVVEDHSVVADGIKETLELEGWRIAVCASGRAGRHRIERVKRSPPRPASPLISSPCISGSHVR